LAHSSPFFRILPVGKVYEILESSALLPVMEAFLKNDSVLDMTRRADTYTALLNLMSVMTTSKELARLFLSLEGHSILCQLELLGTQAEGFEAR
jgi:hypothetical protein